MHDKMKKTLGACILITTILVGTSGQAGANHTSVVASKVTKLDKTQLRLYGYGVVNKATSADNITRFEVTITKGIKDVGLVGVYDENGNAETDDWEIRFDKKPPDNTKVIVSAKKGKPGIKPDEAKSIVLKSCKDKTDKKATTTDDKGGTSGPHDVDGPNSNDDDKSHVRRTEPVSDNWEFELHHVAGSCSSFVVFTDSSWTILNPSVSDPDWSVERLGHSPDSTLDLLHGSLIVYTLSDPLEDDSRTIVLDFQSSDPIESAAILSPGFAFPAMSWAVPALSTWSLILLILLLLALGPVVIVRRRLRHAA